MLALVLLILPAAVSAQVSFPYWPSDAKPLLPCRGLDCVDLCQLTTLFQRLIYFGMTVAVEVIAPIFLIVGAFFILTAGGSAERVSRGKSVLTSTVVGIMLALGAFLIVNTFLWALGNNPVLGGPNKPGGVSWPNVACRVQAPPPPPAPSATTTTPPATPPAGAPPASPPLVCGADNGTPEGANGTCADPRAKCELFADTRVTQQKYRCIVPAVVRRCGEMVNGASVYGTCPDVGGKAGSCMPPSGLHPNFYCKYY